MKREMHPIYPLQEKICELHDKLSDAILSTVRSHHVSLTRVCNTDRLSGNGFVFFKEFPECYTAAVREAKSLNEIRTALENLEDQLGFLHTVQVQQRAERDAAIARLEQSRIFLAQRLSEHHGKKYKVIEEALEFVGDAGQFVSTNFTSAPKFVTRKGIRLNLIKVIVSIFGFAKKSVKINEIGVFGNAALIAFSMLALLHLHQTGSKDKYVLGLPEENAFYNKSMKRSYRSENSSSSEETAIRMNALVNIFGYATILEVLIEVLSSFFHFCNLIVLVFDCI